MKRERRLRRFALWRWFLDRVWLRMKPSARRMCSIVSMLAVGELLLIVFVAVIYRIQS